MEEGFPKRFRIKKRTEFKKIYEEGNKINGRFVIVHYLENELNHPRIGITVTRKVGRAVIRNRWKRLIREIFRKNKGHFPPKDMVITVKRGMKLPTYRELEEDIIETVSKIAENSNS